MGWVPASEYDQGQFDPVADATGEIGQPMNTDHKDALILVARVFAGIESQEAAMTSVDRLGFHVRLNTQGGMRGARIAFLREVSNPAETRKVLVEMVQQARQRCASVDFPPIDRTGIQSPTLLVARPYPAGAEPHPGDAAPALRSP